MCIFTYVKLPAMAPQPRVHTRGLRGLLCSLERGRSLYDLEPAAVSRAIVQVATATGLAPRHIHLPELARAPKLKRWQWGYAIVRLADISNVEIAGGYGRLHADPGLVTRLMDLEVIWEPGPPLTWDIQLVGSLETVLCGWID